MWTGSGTDDTEVVPPSNPPEARSCDEGVAALVRANTNILPKLAEP
jgi:hypothetical protein